MTSALFVTMPAATAFAVLVMMSMHMSVGVVMAAAAIVPMLILRSLAHGRDA